MLQHWLLFQMCLCVRNKSFQGGYCPVWSVCCQSAQVVCSTLRGISACGCPLALIYPRVTGVYIKPLVARGSQAQQQSSAEVSGYNKPCIQADATLPTELNGLQAPCGMAGCR